MLVSGVITQGARHTSDWVTEYRVSYSLDGQRWDYYKENGTAKVILYYTEYLWYIPMLSMLSTIIYRLNITYGLRSFLQNKCCGRVGVWLLFQYDQYFFHEHLLYLEYVSSFQLLNCNQLIKIQIFAKFYKNLLFSSDDLKFALTFE